MLTFSIHRIRYNVEGKNPRLTGVYTWTEVCQRCVFSVRPVEFFHYAFLMKSDSFLLEGNSMHVNAIRRVAGKIYVHTIIAMIISMKLTFSV